MAQNLGCWSLLPLRQPGQLNGQPTKATHIQLTNPQQTTHVNFTSLSPKPTKHNSRSKHTKSTNTRNTEHTEPSPKPAPALPKPSQPSSAILCANRLIHTLAFATTTSQPTHLSKKPTKQPHQSLAICSRSPAANAAAAGARSAPASSPPPRRRSPWPGGAATPRPGPASQAGESSGSTNPGPVF